MTNPLTTHTQTPQTLSEAQIAQLYTLYQTYYGGTTPELFCRDLQEKDQILILQDNQTPIGFTTLKIIRSQHQNQPIRAIFSGDTIIHHQYWGSQTLPLAWCELVGKIQAQEPHIPLYWLLIVKGDRTYRYLNVFSKQYYPNRKTPTPPEIQSLINQLARERFGAHYHPQRGIVHYPQSQGHLAEAPPVAVRSGTRAFGIADSRGHDDCAQLDELSRLQAPLRGRLCWRCPAVGPAAR